MSKKLAVANGSYQKDGQEKTRWVNVGVILEKNGKEFALIDPTINFAAFPREQGKDMVMVGVFDDSQQPNSQGQQNGNYQQPQQQQSYQQPQQVFKNAQGQITDANGNLLLDGNGQPRYNLMVKYRFIVKNGYLTARKYYVLKYYKESKDV